MRSRLTQEQRVMPANPGTTQPEAERWTCSHWAVKLPHPVKLTTVSEQSSRYGRFCRAGLFRPPWSRSLSVDAGPLAALTSAKGRGSSFQSAEQVPVPPAA